MAGISIKVTVDDKEMRRELKKLVGKMKNQHGFFKNVGEYWLPTLHERFASETAPDGTPWTVLSPVTVDARLKEYGNAPLTILRIHGDLAGSYNYQAHETYLEMGSSSEFSAIHHFGGQAGRNLKVTIPARPMLGFEPDAEEEIIEIAKEWLEVE